MKLCLGKMKIFKEPSKFYTTVFLKMKIIFERNFVLFRGTHLLHPTLIQKFIFYFHLLNQTCSAMYN